MLVCICLTHWYKVGIASLTLRLQSPNGKSWCTDCSIVALQCDAHGPRESWAVSLPAQFNNTADMRPQYLSQNSCIGLNTLRNLWAPTDCSAKSLILRPYFACTDITSVGATPNRHTQSIDFHIQSRFASSSVHCRYVAVK